jgi:glycosyl transferase family 25
MVPAKRAAIISYEATCLKYVPRSQRRKGQVLYEGNMLQCLGAYFVNREFSESMTRLVKERKCDRGIDTVIDNLRKETGFCDLYWCHPVIAEQGSHNGRMSSALGNAVKGNLTLIRVRRSLTKTYKKLIYFLR